MKHLSGLLLSAGAIAFLAWLIASLIPAWAQVSHLLRGL